MVHAEMKLLLRWDTGSKLRPTHSTCSVLPLPALPCPALATTTTTTGAENNYNLFTVRKNSDAATDEDRSRLEVGACLCWRWGRAGQERQGVELNSGAVLRMPVQ